MNFKWNIITDSLPTSLTISPNGSTVYIYPNMGYDVGILYQLSESATPMRVSVPIPLQVPDSITFIQCQINSTFIIGIVACAILLVYFICLQLSC